VFSGKHDSKKLKSYFFRPNLRFYAETQQENAFGGEFWFIAKMVIF
jgi:hypothetical protein